MTPKEPMREPAGSAAGREFQELIARAQRGDAEARAEVIATNLGLVRSIVSRFTNRGEDPEDLFQLGSIGLVKAMERYDPGYGTQFSTYAVPLIIGEIKRYLRDNGPIKVSRRLKEVAHRAQQAAQNLARKLEREPNLREIADELGLPPDEVLAALDGVRSVASLQEPVFGDEGEPILLEDQVAADPQAAETNEERLTLRLAMQQLPPRERLIIYWRFFQDLTQTEIARKIGVSQVQVSRLEKKALSEIRRLIG
ncbi:MAG: SigB/SigF/SigG family RNA polymerase sigma factor [Bacillota bacterium]